MSRRIRIEIWRALLLAVLAAAIGCSSGRVDAAGTRPTGDQVKHLQEGIWGGDRLNMTVAEKGAQLEFDCAAGTIDEPLTVDANGRLTALGTFSPEHAGPVRRDEQPVVRRARYEGSLAGTTLHLTIWLDEDTEPMGEYDLVSGSEGVLRKCR